MDTYFGTNSYPFTGKPSRLRTSQRLVYSDAVKLLEPSRYWRLGDVDEFYVIPPDSIHEEITGVQDTLYGLPDRADSLILNDSDAAMSFNSAQPDWVATDYLRALSDRDLRTTVTFWTEVRSTSRGSILTNPRTSSSFGNMHIDLLSDHRISISINAWSYSPYTTYYISNAALETDVISFVAVVLDQYEYRIYINGVLDSVHNANHVFSGWGAFNQIEIARQSNYSFSTSYLDGTIDELAVFEYALPYEDIQYLYKVGNDYGYIIQAKRGQFGFNGFPAEFQVNATHKFICHSANFPFIGHPARGQVIKNTEGYADGTLPMMTGAAQQTADSLHLLASDPIWYEAPWPPLDWDCAPGALPGEFRSEFYPCKIVDLDTLQLGESVLVGELLRNDALPLPNWTSEGSLVRTAHVILSGCDVSPKEILYDTENAGDQHFIIKVSNNDIGRPLLVESMQVLENGFQALGMEILEADLLPYEIDPYTYAQFTLVIYGDRGNQKIDAVLEVRVGTCDTDIPITGIRDIDCPTVIPCPPIPPCPPCPDEEIDMAHCMVEQQLCPINRGDTVPFDFHFTDSGDPMNVSGMTLRLEMKEDVKQEEPDLVKEIVFPDDSNSRNGLGGMKLYPVDTNMLVAGLTYCFKFLLINGPTDVSTVGRGTQPVNPDPIAST